MFGSDLGNGIARPVTRRYEGFPGASQGSGDRDALAALPYAVTIDKALVASLVSFIASSVEHLSQVGLDRLVIGLSGGADSVACAALAREAVGRTRLLGVTVDLGRPGEPERIEKIADSAARLGIAHKIIGGAGLRAAMLAIGGSDSPWRPINIDTRAIQSILFQTADDHCAGVIATSDRSERLLGRYTEHFYGHLAPLAHLFKTEIVQLVRHLGAANCITENRPGCEDYWFDDEVLGAGYEVIDPLLYLLVDQLRSVDDIAAQFAVTDRPWLNAIAARVAHQPCRVIEQVPPAIRRP